MLSPFFAWLLSSAKMRSCLRMRLAPSISIELAMSRSSLTCLALSSERCMARAKERRIAAGTAGGTAAEKRIGKLQCRRRKERHPSSAGPRAGVPAPETSLSDDRAPGQVGRSVTGLEIAVKERGQLRLGERADLLRMHLPRLVQDHRRDAADAVLAGGRGIG